LLVKISLLKAGGRGEDADNSILFEKILHKQKMGTQKKKKLARLMKGKGKMSQEKNFKRSQKQ